MGSHHGSEAPLTEEQRRNRSRAQRLLLAVLIPIALATAVGAWLLWPSADRPDFQIKDPYATTTGVSVDEGEVVRTDRGVCPSSQVSGTDLQSVDPATQPQCLIAYTRPAAGGFDVAVEVSREVEKADAPDVGDRIKYLNYAEVAGPGASGYMFVDYVRDVPIILLAIVYAFVVVAVARWRGLRAMIGLFGAYLVLAYFIIPAIMEGKDPILVGLVGSMLIMIGALYFAHGFSARTSTALLGTLFGLLTITALSSWAISAIHLTGLGDENTYKLINSTDQFTIRSVILCGLIIAGLGVLNDVTITQASAVWELHELAPHESARRLFAGAMRIGRDHIASTVYTIAFAYAGAALPLLIIVSMYDPGFTSSLTGGVLAEEVVRTLVGSIGLVLAIPVTTFIAVLVVKAVSPRASAPSDLAPSDLAAPTRSGRHRR